VLPLNTVATVLPAGGGIVTSHSVQVENHRRARSSHQEPQSFRANEHVGLCVDPNLRVEISAVELYIRKRLKSEIGLLECPGVSQ
jgi:hypothetical protein